MIGRDSIQVEDLSLRIPLARGGSRTLWEHLYAEFPRAAITAVAGPSGSGKSTLLRALNRMVEPSRGVISLGGTSIARFPVRELRRRVALVAQTPIALTETVSDELRVARSSLRRAESDGLLELVGIGHLCGERTRNLSGGELQRLCLARTLAVEPDFVLADETTSALDPASKERVESVFRTVAERGVGVILVSHDLAQVERLADRRVTLSGDARSIAADGMKDAGE